MVRNSLAVMIAVALSFLAGVSLGQDEPHAEHAMPGGHSATEHGMHGGHEHGIEDAAMAEDFPEVQQQNFLMWLISSLGWKYTLLLPFSALTSFVLTAVLVIAGKGRTTGAAMAFVVAIPFLIGLLGTFEGLMASFMVIAHSTSAPKPSVLAEGIGTSIVTLPVAMFLMAPSYLLATAGLFIRSLQRDPLK